jgi:hypothetical protein
MFDITQTAAHMRTNFAFFDSRVSVSTRSASSYVYSNMQSACELSAFNVARPSRVATHPQPDGALVIGHHVRLGVHLVSEVEVRIKLLPSCLQRGTRLNLAWVADLSAASVKHKQARSIQKHTAEKNCWT